MQEVSAIYQSILTGPHAKESRLLVDGTAYGESTIIKGSLKTAIALFAGDTPAAGGAVAGEIAVELLGVASASVARMAKLEPQVRLVGADGRVSEWVAQGVFNVDKRSYNKQTGVLTLHGYDKMLATEQWYTGTGNTATDITIVNRVCTQVGVTLDDETAAFFRQSGRSYVFTAPRDYTCRELLQAIAGLYGGNWIMTAAGKLRLVLLAGLPTETNYLVDSVGNYILVGGDRIVLG